LTVYVVSRKPKVGIIPTGTELVPVGTKVKAGDIIVRIGDKSTADMTTDEAVDLIRGPKGTEVSLTIYRQDWQETRDFKLTRDVINVPSH